MALELLAIFQHDGLCVRVMVFPPSALVLAILVFVILLPFGCGLLDPPGVFVVVASVWILPEDFLF